MRQIISFSLVILSLAALPSWFATAGSYDIKTMTPEIRAAIENRQSRYDALNELKAKGAAGENNRGYVEALGGEASSLVEAENTDRRTIYNAIVSQNNLGPAGLPQVEAVFAEVQRDKARPGDSIQLPSGERTRK